MINDILMVIIGSLGKGTEDEEIWSAVDVLNRFGTILCVYNGVEPMIILDPEWIVLLFKSLLIAKQNFEKDGVVSFNTLHDHIWKEPDFPGEFHQVMLNIFENFEVMFRLTKDITDTMMNISIPENDQLLLIPGFLPVQKPTDYLPIWFGAGNLLYSRQYKFKFIPHGLFNRLIFRLLKFAPAKRFWRNGVLIKNKKSDSHALVELKDDFNMITIEVRSPTSNPESTDFFCNIIELLEFLLSNGFSLQVNVTYIDPSSNCKFTRETIEQSSLNGKWILESGDFKIRIDSIAPDIAMSGLRSFQIHRFEDEVEVGVLLGEGAFAQVYKGVFKNQTVAIKRLNMKQIKTEEQARRLFNEFRKEVITMSMLNHPNVVNLLGFSVETPFSLVMDYVACGTMYDYLKANGDTLPWEMRLRIANDIASCMAFLHSFEPPVIHRDLKSPNILMASTDYTADVVAKVADFGISGKLYSTEFKATKAKDRQVVNPTWLSPEILREEVSGAPSDVYPYGIMLWELVTGKHPYDELGFQFTMDIEDAIKENTRPSIPVDCPDIYSELVRDCWDGNPQHRPTFQQILTTRLPEIIDSLAPSLKDVLDTVSQRTAKQQAEKLEGRKEKFALTPSKPAASAFTPRASPQVDMLTSFASVYDRIKNWNHLCEIAEEQTPSGSNKSNDNVTSSRSRTLTRNFSIGSSKSNVSSSSSASLSATNTPPTAPKTSSTSPNIPRSTTNSSSPSRRISSPSRTDDIRKEITPLQLPPLSASTSSQDGKVPTMLNALQLPGLPTFISKNASSVIKRRTAPRPSPRKAETLAPDDISPRSKSNARIALPLTYSPLLTPGISNLSGSAPQPSNVRKIPALSNLSGVTTSPSYPPTSPRSLTPLPPSALSPRNIVISHHSHNNPLSVSAPNPIPHEEPKTFPPPPPPPIPTNPSPISKSFSRVLPPPTPPRGASTPVKTVPSPSLLHKALSTPPGYSGNHSNVSSPPPPTVAPPPLPPSPAHSSGHLPPPPSGPPPLIPSASELPHDEKTIEVSTTDKTISSHWTVSQIDNKTKLQSVTITFPDASSVWNDTSSPFNFNNLDSEQLNWILSMIQSQFSSHNK
eukprot:TRINITY_DN5431_c0_g1_i1.p1 TRINITY_DN5431_c0_g1~~TRINITY_DN5431_c0_g1_i1.p1  ORF type:complete len:1097 (+),score=298.15 TRINITY_DN5431_c0_g1_i1:802-4092(+)